MNISNLITSLQNVAQTITSTNDLMTISKVIEKVKVGSITSVQDFADLPSLPLSVNGNLYFIDSEGELVYNIDKNWYIVGISRNVYTWGNNTYGQLGDGTNISRAFPGILYGGLLSGWTQVSGRSNFAIGLTRDGLLYAWGYNGIYQLGDGTTFDKNSPIKVLTNNTDWTQISSSTGHSLALTSSGIGYAWGQNAYNQLGINGIGSIPTSIVGNLTWSQLSAGTNYSLGVTTTGLAYGWGLNSSGQLGLGDATNRATPTILAGGITNWKQVDAGIDTHSLGVTSSGIAYAWGYNASGELGTNNTVSRSSPVTVIGGITNWSQLSAGQYFSLGLTSSGIAYAWGYNANGQLGDNTTVSKSSPVTVVGGITNWSQVSAGTVSSFGITSSGVGYGWGTNNNNQLGTYPSNSPATMSGNLKWKQLVAGSIIGLGLTDNMKS